MHQAPDSRPWWPYALGALATATLAALLLLGDPHPSPAPETTPTAAAATTQASTATRSAEPTPATSRPPAEETSTPQPTAPSTAGPSPSSTSPARQQQDRLEQQAIAQAASELDAEERRRAEQVAAQFISTANTQTWDQTRAQWTQHLEGVATDQVIAQMDQERDWNSQYRADFVKTKSTTSARVTQAQVQNVTDGNAEVAVLFTVATTSEDPWLQLAPTEQSETVVVDVHAEPPRVIARSSMEPSGGL